MKLAMKKQSVKGVISLVGFIVSIPVAFLNPVISEIIFVGINILWVIPDKNIENALEE